MDEMNRQYCKEHAGNSYTQKEALTIHQEMDGFYNCRHKLTGLVMV